MKKKAIVFDLDGTLLDTKYDLLNAVNYVRIKNGLDKIDVSELYFHIGRGMKVLVEETLSVDPMSENFNIVYNDFLEYYNNHSLDYTKPFKNVLETLNILKRKGYLLSVVSNKNDKDVKKIINNYFNNIFDYVIGAFDNIPKKPAPDLVFKALNSLNIKKEDAVYVGDSKFDLLTAINSNLDHILVTYGYSTSKEEIISLGGKVFIDDFSELLNILGC